MKNTICRIKIFFTATILFFTLLNLSCNAEATPKIAWSTQFGSSQGCGPESIIVDSNGNLYIVGEVTGNLYGTSAGEQDAYAVKYNAAGNQLWGRQFGSNKIDATSSAALNGDNGIYIVGFTEGSLYEQNQIGRDAFIAKYSASGNIVWTKQPRTDTSDEANGVAIDQQGNVIVVGYTTGVMFGSSNPEGQQAAFIIKYSSSGEQAWGKQLWAEYSTEASSTAIDSQNNIIVAGDTEDLFVPAGDQLNQDSFLLKLNASSEQLWGHQFGTTNIDGATAVCVDPNGNIYVGGTMDLDISPEGAEILGAKGYIAKYDSDGNQIWLQQLSSEGYQEVMSLALGNDGNIYVVGYTTGNLYGTNAGQEDAYIACYNSSGNYQWGYQFGTTSADGADAVCVDSAGNIYVTGYTDGSLYGTNSGNSDTFVVKFGVLPTPAFDPDGGTYQSPQSVSITCATQGTTIRYTTDGTTPTESSTEYTSPVAVNTSLTLKAKAWKTDYVPSGVKTAIYELKLPTPTFNPDAGAYQSAQNVTISCAVANASIMYTLDDSDPTEQSLAYTGPVSIDHSLTLKAKAFKTGWTASDIKSAFYYIGDLPAPTFNPDGGTYQAAQDVTISCAVSGSTIRYTTDGTNPTESSAVYTGPVAVNQSCTLKAKAWKTGWNASDIASAAYELKLPTPAFNPDGGTYQGTQNVTISCTISGATIRYTADGNDPTESSAVYTGPVAIGHRGRHGGLSLGAGMVRWIWRWMVWAWSGSANKYPSKI